MLVGVVIRENWGAFLFFYLAGVTFFTTSGG